MRSSTTRPLLRRIGAKAGTTLGLVALLVVVTAAPAVAAPAPASAHAANLSLLGVTVLDTGTCSPTCTNSTPLSALPAQTAITAGVLAQQIGPPNPGGTSASACAGLVGTGGAIQIGATPGCTVTQGIPFGVTIGGFSLPLATGPVLAANAIYSFCSTDTATGGVSGGSQLVAATIGGSDLPVNPAPNTTFTLPAPLAALGSLTLNARTILGNGNVQFTALDLNIPNIAHLVIGQVSCPVLPAATPVLPTKGLPIAGAMILGFGGAAWFGRRRLFPGLRDRSSVSA